LDEKYSLQYVLMIRAMNLLLTLVQPKQPECE
jgi:hypothetical protein